MGGMSKGKGVVRPWGLLGGRYEVAGPALWLYRFNLALVIAIVFFPITRSLEWGIASFYWPLVGLCLCYILATCFAVTRMGKRLD